MDDGVITTATSQDEGRLKVGAGSMRSKKKKVVQAAVKDFKKSRDGKGGPGDPSGLNLAPPTYGAANTTGMLPSSQGSSGPASNLLQSSAASPTLSLSNKTTGFKMARPLKLKGFPKNKKPMSSISSSIKGLKRKMKF